MFLPSIFQETSELGFAGPAKHIKVKASPILPCFGPIISTFTAGTENLYKKLNFFKVQIQKTITKAIIKEIIGITIHSFAKIL